MNLKSLLTTNVQLKLLSLLLAALLWLFIAFEAVDEVELPLSVSYVNTPPGLTVKPNQGSEPLLRIAGPRILLLRQQLKGVTASLDLSGAKEGDLLLAGGRDSLKLVQGVKIVRLPSLQVTLSRL